MVVTDVSEEGVSSIFRAFCPEFGKKTFHIKVYIYEYLHGSHLRRQ
jgi:hypothetical protein